MARKRKITGREKTPTIDWQGIRQRPNSAAERLQHGMSPAQKQDILTARAVALAREPHGDETATESLTVLEFLLAYETYGIELSFVRETRPLRDLTPIPGTPPFVLGVINVR